MDRILVVIAHSDDELLGCGATIIKEIEEGNEVSVCCITHDAPTREKDISNTMVHTHKELGVKNTFIGEATALTLSNEKHIDIVQFIERAIVESDCDVIITHSSADLHPDHRLVHEATMEAMRLPQRHPNGKFKSIRKVLCMEIPCSNAWGLFTFKPVCYSEVKKEHIERKIELIEEYDNVIRETPHPRSVENIFALARYRGSQFGSEFAEAFEVRYEEM